MTAFFMDCYKKPDLIKEAQNVMLEEQLKMIATRPDRDYVIGEWIGGWRGASGLVSPKIWDNLVWPYMYKLALALIERGITPILHLDQNWDRDLERFLELPENKCIINTDGMTDLRKARKVLGNHVAFMGDVPSQMLTVSTPDEVKDYIRRLLDDIGVKGVILAAGCDAPTGSKFENLVAIHEVAQEY
jgi:uroporphyrinogen-III decarboxylase